MKTNAVKRVRTGRHICGECGQYVHPAVFHPFLYCLLYKNGVSEQEKYLRDSGFVRAASVPRGQHSATTED